MKHLFILVPSDSPAGPVKGAYALANALAGQREVTLVSLKHGPGAQARLAEGVRRLCLADLAGSMAARVRAYRALLRDAGGRQRVASLSMCLSADAVNAMCRGEAVTCASVRGNLPVNYRYDYGMVGVPLAWVHLFALRLHDRVVAMNAPMAEQVRRFSGRSPAVIGNFVDELPLEAWRAPAQPSGALRFVFVGTLSQRKQPWLVIRAVNELRQRGVDVRADLVGSGPERDRLVAEIDRLGLAGTVTLHGFVAEPARLVGAADALVLPSLSEGISRAALEALQLGVPCVLRDADGNSELLREGSNGALFADDEGLADAMLRAAALSRRRPQRDSLLPEAFRQGPAANQYLNLLESIDAPRT